jgi:predicted NBD/HSP70 family sugar kinase
MILDLIRAHGGISRVELAALTGFTESTISSTVREIMADGLILETGFSESTGGKRRTLLGINRTARHGVGLAIDHERLTYVVTDFAGELVGSLTAEGTGDRHPDDIIVRMATEVRRLLHDLQVDPASVVGIGVASPGPLDGRAGVLRGRQPTPEWSGYPLRGRLEDLVGYPVALDNDATCGAVGELWTSRRGAPRPVSATVYMADGIGCGILIDGGAFHGTSANAGELGHISLDQNGPRCTCGGRGCVDVYAGPPSVVARARKNRALVERLQLTAERGTRGNFARIVKEAARGNEQCLELVTFSAKHLARGVVILCNILDLDEVFLSGPGFCGGGAIYSRVIQDELDAATFMRSVHPVRVDVANMGSEAAALGAATLILQQELTPHSVLRSSGRHVTVPAQIRAWA